MSRERPHHDATILLCFGLRDLTRSKLARSLDQKQDNFILQLLFTALVVGRMLATLVRHACSVKRAFRIAEVPKLPVEHVDKVPNAPKRCLLLQANEFDEKLVAQFLRNICTIRLCCWSDRSSRRSGRHLGGGSLSSGNRSDN